MAKSQLHKTFEEYNHKYFNDRLFDVEVKWSKGKTLTANGDVVCGYAWLLDYKKQEIVLAKYLRKSHWMWKLVLLHEMNHVDLGLAGHDIDHGPVFDAGMLRLAKLGALSGIW